MISSPPVALSIAGSDCSAGAGLQADLKTFQHFRVHGLTAVTCVVVETANEVRGVEPVSPETVCGQVEILLDSFPVGAVKTGMLYSAAHLRGLSRLLAGRPVPNLVVDPVMVASTGDPLLEPDAVELYRERLLPLATLITPNLPEAEVLLGRPIRDVSELESSELESAARGLADRYGVSVLLKGGHLPGPDCLDLLLENGGVHLFSSPRLGVPGSHGTGCTLSAAITACLARGLDLPAAVAAAKEYLNSTLRDSYSLQGPGPTPVHALNQGTAPFLEDR